ncbi:precorrin-6A reductase [Brevibacillus ginsengisoli]|uniref:precorrin-6A reductase n=1 Tax=Brevibacillus ginsengisoli TaxID=363854 RepID=UPI003CF30097
MILLLAGTSDARILARLIKEQGMKVTATVVNERTAREIERIGVRVHVGRMSAEAFTEMIQKQGITAVVDASHPFAEEASLNAIQATANCQVPYLRYERPKLEFIHSSLIPVESYREAAELATQKKGVILLTTGSKTLPLFAEKLNNQPDIRVLTRILPRMESLLVCEKLGFAQENIIAIQGPFSKELNKAIYQQFGVTLMITKESGQAGSVDEKVAAAIELGIETIMIRRPSITYGTVYSQYEDVIKHLQRIREEDES